MSKGFNSVLFDFNSVVDKELSVIKYLRGEYMEAAVDWLDKSALRMDDNYLRYKRLYRGNLFKSMIIKEDVKDSSDNLLDLIFNRDQDCIFDRDYAYTTAMKYLISAYKKVGNGIIKTVVRCDNDKQARYIKDTLNADVIVTPRQDVDMSKYGRLVVGQFASALEYVLNEPKSIVVLNFRENYDTKDITLLNPELVIKLGDIHKIEIFSAFREEIPNDLKGEINK